MLGVRFKNLINLKRFGEMDVVPKKKRSKENSAVEARCACLYGTHRNVKERQVIKSRDLI
jgi:hypothetical protein